MTIAPPFKFCKRRLASCTRRSTANAGASGKSISTRCEWRPRNESHQSCRPQHQPAHPPHLPRAVPNGIRPACAAVSGKRAAIAAAFPHGCARAAAAAENEGGKRADGTEVGFVFVSRTRHKLPIVSTPPLRSAAIRLQNQPNVTCSTLASRPPPPAIKKQTKSLDKRSLKSFFKNTTNDDSACQIVSNRFNLRLARCCWWGEQETRRWHRHSLRGG